MNVTKIQSCFGLARYYRRFIEGFSIIATLLTRLTKKKVKFEWLEECEKGFQELKEKAYHYSYPNTSVRDRRFVV